MYEVGRRFCCCRWRAALRFDGQAGEVVKMQSRYLKRKVREKKEQRKEDGDGRENGDQGYN